MESIIFILGILLGMVIVFNTVSYWNGHIGLIGQYRIYKTLKKTIPKMLPDGWTLKTVDFITIGEDDFNTPEAYIKLINKKKRIWTNDWVKIDRAGNIIHEQFTESIKREEL